jgi:hypothetical protein
MGHVSNFPIISHGPSLNTFSNALTRTLQSVNQRKNIQCNPLNFFNVAKNSIPQFLVSIILFTPSISEWGIMRLSNDKIIKMPSSQHTVHDGRVTSVYYTLHMCPNYFHSWECLDRLSSFQSNGYWSFSPGVKRTGREADHSPPTSAEVNKTRVYTSTPPYTVMA